MTTTDMKLEHTHKSSYYCISGHILPDRLILFTQLGKTVDEYSSLQPSLHILELCIKASREGALVQFHIDFSMPYNQCVWCHQHQGIPVQFCGQSRAAATACTVLGPLSSLANREPSHACPGIFTPSLMAYGIGTTHPCRVHMFLFSLFLIMVKYMNIKFTFLVQS